MKAKYSSVSKNGECRGFPSHYCGHYVVYEISLWVFSLSPCSFYLVSKHYYASWVVESDHSASEINGQPGEGWHQIMTRREEMERILIGNEGERGEADQ